MKGSCSSAVRFRSYSEAEPKPMRGRYGAFSTASKGVSEKPQRPVRKTKARGGESNQQDSTERLTYSEGQANGTRGGAYAAMCNVQPVAGFNP
jgi:hypothetical protein